MVAVYKTELTNAFTRPDKYAYNCYRHKQHLTGNLKDNNISSKSDSQF